MTHAGPRHIANARGADQARGAGATGAVAAHHRWGRDARRLRVGARHGRVRRRAARRRAVVRHGGARAGAVLHGLHRAAVAVDRPAGRFAAGHPRGRRELPRRLPQLGPPGACSATSTAPATRPEAGDVGRSTRVVVLERTAGQLVLIGAALLVLPTHPALIPSLLGGVQTKPIVLVGVGLGVLAATAFVLLRARRNGARTSAGGPPSTKSIADLRSGVLARGAWPGSPAALRRARCRATSGCSSSPRTPRARTPRSGRFCRSCCSPSWRWACPSASAAGARAKASPRCRSGWRASPLRSASPSRSRTASSRSSRAFPARLSC